MSALLQLSTFTCLPTRSTTFSRIPTRSLPKLRNNLVNSRTNATRIRLFTTDVTSKSSIQTKDVHSLQNEVNRFSKVETTATLKRLLQLARPEFGLLAVGMGSLAVSVASNLAFPAGMGLIIDTISGNRADWSLSTLGLGLGGIVAIGSVATFARITLLSIASERMVFRMRNQLFESIIHQEVGFFDKNKAGELINRLSTDTGVISRTMTANLAWGLRAIVEGLGGVGILFWLSPKLTLLMLSVMPPVGVGAVIYGKYMKDFSKKIQDELAKTSDIAEERFNNIRTVRSFAKEARETDRYIEKSQSVYELGKKMAYIHSGFVSFVHTAGSFSVLAVLTYGGHLVLNEAMSVGSLSSFVLYSLYVLVSSSTISSFYGDLMKAVGASNRVFELLDRKPEIDNSGNQMIDHIKGNIEFRDIVFYYPMRPDVTIFNQFNLTAKNGQAIALVGSSGSGKSTVAALLSRFYQPSSGQILIDGYDIKKLDPIWLRQQIGLVSQDVTLFAGTIADNISYGAENATLEEIQNAAKQAYAHDFISGFPDGYNTVIGPRGISLSAGQAQRVGIARAILKNPKILILDEATSFLDAENERLIQKALEKLMVGRTVIIIAHRLSTIRNANTIHVLNQGKIVESGTYQDLMAIENGTFRQLVELQMK